MNFQSFIGQYIFLQSITFQHRNDKKITNISKEYYFSKYFQKSLNYIHQNPQKEAKYRNFIRSYPLFLLSPWDHRSSKRRRRKRGRRGIFILQVPRLIFFIKLITLPQKWTVPLKTKGTLPLAIGPVFNNVWDGNFQTYFAEVCLPYVLGLSVVRNTRDENF